MSMYVTTNMDDWEAAMAYDRAKGAFLAANLTDGQKVLCDGQEHYAFYIDAADGSLGVCRIRSRQEILDGEYPEEVELWFDEEGRASRGYLPCHTWDAVYQPDQPDLHDRHASILMEITPEEFEYMKDHGWSIPNLLYNHYYVDLLNQYLHMAIDSQARLDVWEREYKSQ
jgi:hypothetical protein